MNRATAIALASLVAAGQISPIQGTLPLVAALSANTAVRLWISVHASEPSYRWAVSGGLVLQLAALSMQGREDVPGFVAAFACDDRYILDYLIEEVFEDRLQGGALPGVPGHHTCTLVFTRDHRFFSHI